MDLQVIEHLDDPRLDDYRNVRDADLLRERGLFMAEGRLVVECLLERSPLRPRSVLVTPVVMEAMGPVLREHEGGFPIYVAPASLFDEVAGFHVHRGCLAAGERPAQSTLAQLLASAQRPRRVMLILEGLTDTDNVGSLFRNARAFGVDAVLLCPRCCDPLYRKAIRTSLGASLCIPYARAGQWPSSLRALQADGYRLVALHPGADSQDFSDYALRAGWSERTALIVGSEGAGLRPETLELADVCLRVAMAPDVDSLNVGTAAGIALHSLHRATTPSARADPISNVGAPR